MRAYRCCAHCERSSCRLRYWQTMLVRPPRDEHPWACLLCEDGQPGRQVAA